MKTQSPDWTVEAPAQSASNFKLHINFIPQLLRNTASANEACDEAHSSQIREIVTLIQSHQDRMEHARANGGTYRVAVLGRTRNALAPIAQALRVAKIPFRSVDLEKLSARPEVLDAVALARALLNPVDRVAWLGTLRAPWCGLSLADLHTLTSADSAEILTRPIPYLLAERLHQLSTEGRQAIERVLEVLSAAPALRFSQPTASLGTWLQQVWLRLGGAQCVDPTAHANLNLLWQSLDSLPNGEQDLLDPALGPALNTLTAQPDPETSSDCGVQLMTIHKSKGLEFEVVIVPELQAASSRGKSRMLTWLERGIPPEDTAHDPGSSPEVTEFLIAPLQSKGSDRGSTKQWADRVYQDRERQETRRILYVAATRAREELHLFARPSYGIEANLSRTLAKPKNSLLATAWPALEEDIRNRFANWRQKTSEREPEGGIREEITLDSLAASAADNLLVMPTPAMPTLLRRLPLNYHSPQAGAFASPGHDDAIVGMDAETLFQRHEGGLLSRALGTAVHALLEELSNLRKSNDWPQSCIILKQLRPRISAQIRATGVDTAKSAALADRALQIALAASVDPTGQWILFPHPEETTEARWTGVIAGTLRSVQVDRLFRAGLVPLSTGADVWWIIDYKTAHAGIPDPTAALPELRAIFAPQLQAYAQVLRKLHGTDAPVRAGLYYPLMSLFDWWEI